MRCVSCCQESVSVQMPSSRTVTPEAACLTSPIKAKPPCILKQSYHYEKAKILLKKVNSERAYLIIHSEKDCLCVYTLKKNVGYLTLGLESIIGCGLLSSHTSLYPQFGGSMTESKWTLHIIKAHHPYGEYRKVLHLPLLQFLTPGVTLPGIIIPLFLWLLLPSIPHS